MNDLLYMEIDLRKLESNIESIKDISKKEIIPVIKSKAYSLGELEIAKFLESINIKYIAVVDMIEALRLIENQITINILILNSLIKSDFDYLNKFQNLVVSISSLKDIEELNQFSLSRVVKVHIQTDTGMNRLGVTELEELKKIINIINQNKMLDLEGIYTHFTDPANRINQEQKFINFINQYPFKIVHCAASSTYEQSQIGNYVRVGLDIYGDGTKKNIKQIIKIACKPLAINYIKKGETLGYNQDYTAEEDLKVAVLPIGYSNGFHRCMRGFPVLVNKKRYNTIGIVCMNHLFVKVDDTINLNSEFIITNEDLPIYELANYINTITHEILCMMNIDKKYYLK